MFTKKFLKDAAERAISTVAQTALALLVAAGSVGIEGINWKAVVSVSAVAGVVSVLKSIVASRLNEPDSASLVDLEKP